MVLSALVSVVSSSVSLLWRYLGAAVSQVNVRLRLGSPTFTPGHQAHLVLGLRLCSDLGPEQPPSRMALPSLPHLAGVCCCISFSLRASGTLFLPSWLSCSLTSYSSSGSTSPSHTLVASCLLPLSEHKQEGRYFYVSDTLLWPRP